MTPQLLSRQSSHTCYLKIIQNIHIKQYHAGISCTITAIRQKYWIPAARQSIKKIIRQCVVCRKHSGAPYQAPDPPPLPKSRVLPHLLLLVLTSLVPYM